MYFRSLGTKYRPASPRLTARAVLFTICLGLGPKHTQSIFHSHFGLDKNKTNPKKISQRRFGSVGATELSHARYGWSALLLEIHFINEISQIFQSNWTFQSQNQNLRVDNVISNSGQFLAPRKWVFDPQGWNIARLPSPERFSICTPVLEPKTQLSWSFQFYLAWTGTQGYPVERNERITTARCFGSGGSMIILWTVRAVARNTSSIEIWIHSSDDQPFIRQSMNLESRKDRKLATAVK